jgi:phosphoenolpyruvate phosphomutase
MSRVSSQIFHAQSVAGIEANIAPLNELFAMFDYEELAHAEKRYLSRAREPVEGSGKP